MASDTRWQDDHMPDTLQVGDHTLPLKIRRHQRAKRICLRYNPTSHEINLTLPRHTRISDGINFLNEKSDWLISTLEEIPTQKQLKPGVCIWLAGERYRIKHEPNLAMPYQLRAGVLCIAGKREHFAHNVEDALKRIARQRITMLCLKFADRIGGRVARVTVRDTRSRWGSCYSTGNLSFSWRLIFAPRKVLEYVVAHEIAHLKHMNHSSRFWDLTEVICPNYHVPKEWLRVHGKELYRFNA